MKLAFPYGSKHMQPIPEIPVTSGYAQLNDMTGDVVRFKDKVQSAKDMRSCYLVLVLIAFCIGAVALGHSDPDFYRLGSVSIWIVLSWAFKAIGDVFVSRQQIKLALAILAQRSLTERLPNCSENSNRSFA